MISQVCLIWLSWITCDVETSNLYHWTQDFYTAFEMEKYVFLWDVNTLFEKNYLHAQMQSFEICGMIFWRIYFFLFVLRNLLILYSANGWPASTKHLATKKIILPDSNASAFGSRHMFLPVPHSHTWGNGVHAFSKL